MRIGAAATLATGLFVSCQAYAAPPPPLAFARALQVEEASLSPDGQRVAILGGSPDARTLSIATIDRPGLPTLALGEITTFGVDWIGNYAVARTFYPFTPKGSPRTHYLLERNVVVDDQAKVVSYLLEHDAESDFLIEQPILGTVDGPPGRAIVRGLRTDYATTLWSVDPKTGSGKILEVGGYETQTWSVDSTGAARIREDRLYSRKLDAILGRAKGQTAWKSLLLLRDEPGDRYAGYAEPQDAALFWRFTPGEQALERSRLADGVAQTIWKGPVGESASLIWDRRLHSPVGVLGVSGTTPKLTWFDPQIGAVHATLAKALSNPLLQLRGWSADRSRFVVRTVSPDEPSRWYLFDTSKKQLSPLGDEYPELTGVALGRTRAYAYKARDGFAVSAYLTLPPSGTYAGKLPLVVLHEVDLRPRDQVQFDALAQLIATRGYAVLRPAVRGAFGFGPEYEKAGIGEWGGKMQTDSLDGIAQLAADGLIDPARVCIMGEDSGGYLALAGATMHPAAYQCAIAINGYPDPSAVVAQLKRLYGGSYSYGLKLWTGAETRQDLARISVLTHASQATAPILLIHAADDNVMPIEHARRVQQALQKAGKSVEFVALEKAHHYGMSSANRLTMFTVIEAFLAKNLPTQP